MSTPTSDPIDAERAAGEALSRTWLAQPKTGQDRAALRTLLTVRRGAVNAGADAQRQPRALVITAPEQVRARLRGQSIVVMNLRRRPVTPEHRGRGRARVHRDDRAEVPGSTHPGTRS